MAGFWSGGFGQWLQRGFATLQAEFRRGLKDTQNAVLDPWNGIVATHEEAGTIANPTQQLVTQDLQGDRRAYGVHGPAKSPERKTEKQPTVQAENQPEADQKSAGSKSKSILEDALSRCADRSAERAEERDMDMDR